MSESNERHGLDGPCLSFEVSLFIAAELQIYKQTTANSIYSTLQKQLRSRVGRVGGKQSKDVFLETDVAENMRLHGVVAQLDGAQVIKVPANRLPADFGFMLAHPVATVAPTKLEDYRVHQDPPGISGDLVEGRVCYDAFVLDNKAKAIYYQAQPATDGDD